MTNPNSRTAPNDVISSDDNYPVGGADERTASADNSSDGALAQQIEEHRERYLRVAAEYDNYRRRSTRERVEAAARGQAELIRGMLDSLDDLARFAHLDPATADAETVIAGVAMIERNLMKSLSAAGLEVVDPVGMPFDPNLHEAVSTEPAESAADDHLVGNVYQPGYMLAGQLLRPARVVVKQWNG